MDKSIIKMTYLAEKEDGVLSHDVKGEADENYGEMISKLGKILNNTMKVIDVEQTVFELLCAYEERAYIEGFKNGFNLNNEIRTIN